MLGDFVPKTAPLQNLQSFGYVISVPTVRSSWSSAMKDRPAFSEAMWPSP